MPLNKYEIISKLATGTYSTVYRARSCSKNQQFALKKVQLQSLQQTAQSNAIREAQLLQSICHINIVQLQQIIHDDQNQILWLVLELATQGDLQKKIQSCKQQKKVLKEEQVWWILQQLASGLDYLHSCHIIHRDVKPTNILVFDDFVVKIADLNVSAQTPQGLFRRAGTPIYLSPEAMSGHFYNSKSDIWSLGCVMYELVTLRKAFTAQCSQQLYKQVCRSQRLNIGSNYSQTLKNIIFLMLQQNHKLRPSAKQIYKICQKHKQTKKSYLNHSFSNQKMPSILRHNPTCKMITINRQRLQNSFQRKSIQRDLSLDMPKRTVEFIQQNKRPLRIIKAQSLQSQPHRKITENFVMRRLNIHKRLVMLPSSNLKPSKNI